jgi:hypothetical protein
LDVRGGGAALLLHAASEAKIADACHQPSVEKHIRALHIAVDDLHVRVKVRQTSRHVGENEDALVGRERTATVTAGEALVQRTALHQRVHEARLRPVEGGAVQRHDVGVAHL